MLAARCCVTAATGALEITYGVVAGDTSHPKSQSKNFPVTCIFLHTLLNLQPVKILLGEILVLYKSADLEGGFFSVCNN